MSCKSGDPAEAVGCHQASAADDLLFTVYRCWMAGEETRDVACWEIAWKALVAEMPLRHARALFGEFHHFLRVLTELAGRVPAWRRSACRCLCRDECLVLAMLGAAQRGDLPRQLGAAQALAGPDDLGPLVEAAQSLADALAQRGLFLGPVMAPVPHGAVPSPSRH